MINFDKVFDIGTPEYDGCFDNLFGNYCTKASLKDIRSKCATNQLNYSQIYKLYDLFMRKYIKNSSVKKKDTAILKDLNEALDMIIVENNILTGKTKQKKVGLLDKTRK
jgi:hypothetical protein